jgi:hypothetical protein
VKGADDLAVKPPHVRDVPVGSVTMRRCADDAASIDTMERTAPTSVARQIACANKPSRAFPPGAKLPPSNEV